MQFEKIIEANKQKVRQIINLISGKENEDLEQEVYIRVWKNKDKYQERGTFGAWIGTIAKNLTKDHLKSAQYKKEQLVDQDDNTLEIVLDKHETPEFRLIRNERQERISRAINKLKPKLKEVIIYCEVYGYTYEQAASKFKCPVGTIKSRIYNAKKELAAELQDLL